ncbi:bifunctional tRNA (5-methylaminomethyl-2-thiouridine)(34)-methyltransferase MnmD/FAD-dependent 5-carboxymethylaminomethyl-2-thiouridine(34) oxidoreductase MnmC [Pseudidiomarina taiwanensis]|uniref:tRNA 5-methylaminomethyl-2-thiouridine biosynthesis bifunctional protein MnmC n=1 Tax=Pseudidiomarina taiwanensis TaxID=337250 RepID=A0A432ZJY1_9GAMM|nr:bifunctional tRNA (5-methylaminomethyl-2-thiouridine)(34)-methyltransferase MnmD/FAD-dependent 5-carboxymethylaminomethyl-2-thiouridine(34) oxidoreductase MnmC [Pseudidiomarina taiwanensis]RUO78276.1 bifunctional tRNA (5-methylaminomethyl-2-thiouridine)(34)-methyltransferase MnmD/FAD-dependent 5-carboxymethylaminomethyl-2-thiouridine(34) oxidoreductase MnmC [Pseudidiomarina taiwanensis]
MSGNKQTRPEPAQIQFNELGLPVATQFDDVYFSNDGGLAETRYVFLAQNQLPQRWQEHPAGSFVIAETGFGTGLNFLATWQAFIASAPATTRLHFISFEKFPLQRAELAQALAHFPELQALVTELLDAYPSPEPGCHRRVFAGGRITLDLWFGDLLEQLPDWLPTAQASVDCWFLDGFAPDKNPQMWQPELYHAMAQSSRGQATFATFTAAGAVRRGLQAAGYEVTKVKGFGRKREMLCGQLQAASTASAPDEVIIIGGGIAAASLVQALTRRNIKVCLLQRGCADGASGNAQGAVYPLLHVQRSPLAQFFVAAFGYARQHYQQKLHHNWHESGVLQLNFTPERAARAEQIAQVYAAETVQLWSPEQVQQHWQQLPAQTALWYPQGGWLAPAPAVAQLQTPATKCQHASVTDISTGQQKRWHVRCADGSAYEADYVVLATGADLVDWLPQFGIELQNVRGQVSYVNSSAATQECPSVVCYKGYFTPVLDGQHCVGATYARQYDRSKARQTQVADDQENLATLQSNLAPMTWPSELKVVHQRASERNTSRDHLPIIGELKPGLAVIGALGSRGYTAAPLAAEIIASHWCAEPQPLAAELIERLKPQRLQASP